MLVNILVMLSFRSDQVEIMERRLEDASLFGIGKSESKNKLKNSMVNS